MDYGELLKSLEDERKKLVDELAQAREVDVHERPELPSPQEGGPTPATPQSQSPAQIEGEIAKLDQDIADVHKLQDAHEKALADNKILETAKDVLDTARGLAKDIAEKTIDAASTALDVAPATIHQTAVVNGPDFLKDAGLKIVDTAIDLLSGGAIEKVTQGIPKEAVKDGIDWIQAGGIPASQAILAEKRDEIFMSAERLAQTVEKHEASKESPENSVWQDPGLNRSTPKDSPVASNFLSPEMADTARQLDNLREKQERARQDAIKVMDEAAKLAQERSTSMDPKDKELFEKDLAASRAEVMAALQKEQEMARVRLVEDRTRVG